MPAEALLFNGRVMFHRVIAIALKEVRQVARDRRTLGILVVIPAIMIAMSGYVLNFDVNHTSLAICDEEKSCESRAFTQEILHSRSFDFKYVLNDNSEIDELSAREQCRIAVVIPRDFSHHLKEGADAPVQIVVDGANSNAATTAIRYDMAITPDYSAKIVIQSLQRVGRRDDIRHTGMSGVSHHREAGRSQAIGISAS